MKLTVGFNGDIELIPKLAEYSVKYLFTKMTQDITGGGRSSFLLAPIGWERLKKIIQEAHANNLEFIYLLNTACQSNYEFTRKYNKELVVFIEKLVNLGIDGVVVATPYMLSLIKTRFPHIHVSISIFALVDSLEKAKYWYNIGANRIILSPLLNRNFKELTRIRKAVNCELEIFANVTCLHPCPFTQFHANAVSHASSTKDKNKGFIIDYHVSNCSYLKISKPEEMIKSRWIRPEDINFYEEIGIDVFKIADRQKPSNWILNAVKAYSNRRYEGNLVDILPFPLIRGDFEDFQITSHSKWLLKPKHINVNLLRMYGEKKDPKFFIDNNMLKDFINHFKVNDCTQLECGVECKYCHSIVKKAVKFDPDEVSSIKNFLISVNDMVANGKAFKRNNPLVHLYAFIRNILTSNKAKYYN